MTQTGTVDLGNLVNQNLHQRSPWQCRHPLLPAGTESSPAPYGRSSHRLFLPAPPAAQLALNTTADLLEQTLDASNQHHGCLFRHLCPKPVERRILVQLRPPTTLPVNSKVAGGTAFRESEVTIDGTPKPE